MERERLKRSDEEKDTLARSTKKFKENHRSHETTETEYGIGNKMGSYKDKLVGVIPGAFAQAFGFDSSMQEDVESDGEEEVEQDGNIRISFSKEEKVRMRAPWQKALIIKTFGRRMAFSFLVERVRKMWNPCGGMDCIDLGYDYFLVRFELAEDVDTILTGGPWFIGQHFLAIRQWEPGFKASTATLSSVAVWIRLPELPLEFYDSNALLKIGRAIGPVLRIDSHTANGERGRFARLCVQVNLEKPLIRKIYLGKIPQCVLYEGISALCFSCGRIGHKLESCPYIIREQPKEQNVDRSNGQEDAINSQGVDRPKDGEAVQENYGEWMVVSRRKIINKARSIQRSPVLSQASDNAVMQVPNASMDEPKMAVQSRRESKRKSPHTQPVTSLVESSRKAMSNLRHPNIGKGAKGKGVRANASLNANDLVGSHPVGAGPSRKDGPFVFGSKAVHGPFRFSSTRNTLANPKEKLISTEKESSIPVRTRSGDGREGEVGNFLQGEGHSSEQRDHLLDKTRPNRDLGLVRYRLDDGMEVHFPADGEKQTAGISSFEGRGMDHNPESMVEVPDGSSSSPCDTGEKLKVISSRIRRAELGKISGRSGRGVDEGSDHRKEDVAEEPGGMFVDGQPAQGENDPVCRAGDKWYDSCQGNPRGFGDNQACSGSLQGDLGVEGGDFGSMEVERP
nr:uncharacterized protein CFP56_29768 [Quercus suber]